MAQPQAPPPGAHDEVERDHGERHHEDDDDPHHEAAGKLTESREEDRVAAARERQRRAVEAGDHRFRGTTRAGHVSVEIESSVSATADRDGPGADSSMAASPAATKGAWLPPPLGRASRRTCPVTGGKGVVSSPAE